LIPVIRNGHWRSEIEWRHCAPVLVVRPLAEISESRPSAWLAQPRLERANRRQDLKSPGAQTSAGRLVRLPTHPPPSDEQLPQDKRCRCATTLTDVLLLKLSAGKHLLKSSTNSWITSKITLLRQLESAHYASETYRLALNEVRLRGPMSAVGDAYRNARAESVMKTLKVEDVISQDTRLLPAWWRCCRGSSNESTIRGYDIRRLAIDRRKNLNSTRLAGGFVSKVP
jgi:hypothetical protein